MTDIIGDIHGHADKLESLLKTLGYEIKNEAYTHSERKVLFVGDYIDRGPKIRKALQLVRRMVDAGSAIALMGNHEYNALCFHFQETEGGHLRKHLIKNIIQHYETLKQFQNRQEEYEDYLDWFKTLPLFYESDSFRAVHACWDNDNIKYLKDHLQHNCLTDELIYKSVEKETMLHKAIEDTLKGKEIEMPEGLNFTDKDGNIRTDIRIKWWQDPGQSTYRSISVIPLDYLPDTGIDQPPGSATSYYTSTGKPVFFGHYWLKGTPSLFKSNVCCVDYSVAKQGHLTCYRYKNESTLTNDNFTFI